MKWVRRKMDDDQAAMEMHKAVEEAQATNRSAVKNLVAEALRLIAERKQEERPLVEPINDPEIQ